MDQFVRSLTAREYFVRQMPTLVASIVVAELFYKFHSFTLECGAFLATRFVLDAAVQGAAVAARSGQRGEPEPTS